VVEARPLSSTVGSTQLLTASQLKEQISWTLTYDPSTRPSAKEVLDHPWIQQRASGKAVDSPLAEKSLMALAKFKVTCRQAEQRTQYAVLSFMTSQLINQREVGELSKFFALWDSNHDGRLSPKEVKEGFYRYG
jgi:serine/threonine protein kinase